MSRLSAMAVAAAVVSTPMLGMSGAWAAPQDFGNVDGDRMGSLTVHKFLHQAGDHEGDISEAPAAGDFTDPVADVEFTAYPLVKSGDTDPLDLTVQANWDGLGDLVPGANCTAPAGFTLGSPVVFGLTDADGVSTQALEVGAYQVCETDAPDYIVDMASPFIVTVPTPFEDGWVYDVHAYPKNGATEISKSITEQADLGLGSSVTFPVTNVVPTMEAEDWTGYAISDTLDARLVPNADNKGIVSVKVDGADLDSSYYTKIVDGQTVVLEFTAAGIAWLNTGEQAGKSLEVVFDGIVTELGDGSIDNRAMLWVNNPGRDADTSPGVPTNQVTTNWGALELTKRAAGTTGDTGKLADAVFEVYESTDPYAADCTDAEADGSPIEVDGETRFTSDEDGTISIPGLFVSDSVNPTVDAESRCYVVKEVDAPAGYVQPTGDAAFTGVSVKIGETTTVENADIVNTQQSVPELPLTGGQGLALLAGLGAAGAAVAGGLGLLKRRRRDEAELAS